MGDGADDAINDGLAQLAYDIEHPEELEGPDDPFFRTRRGRYWFGPPLKRCKFCEEFGFVWAYTESGWRLKDPETEVIHSCIEHQRSNPMAEQKPKTEIMHVTLTVSLEVWSPLYDIDGEMHDNAVRARDALTMEIAACKTVDVQEVEVDNVYSDPPSDVPPDDRDRV